MDTDYIWIRVGLNRSPPVHIDGYAHPGWSTACAHCCALDTPAAWPRSSLWSTRDTARCRRAASCRLCSCRRARLALHGTAGIGHTRTTLASVNAHAARACQANRRHARTQSCTFRCRGRRAGFGEESLAVGQLGFATRAARRIVGCHLGVA